MPSHGSHGPHIPLRSTTQNGKAPSVNKIHTYVSSGKRLVKPVRVPTGAHSTRDEIFLPAPSGEHLSSLMYRVYFHLFLGSHSFYKGHNVVKIRETQGLGIPGAPVKQYHLQHHQQTGFGNQFSPPNDIFQYYNPLQYVPKPETHFVAQNDEYTRNLLPPPYKNNQDKSKVKQKPTTKPSLAVTESSTPTNTRFSGNNQGIQHSKYRPQSVELQVPPPSDAQTFNFQQIPSKEKTVELQVTREKLQSFHNTVPPNYLFQQDVNSDKTVNDPPPLPTRIQTYEVTEGKFWQEAPNLYRQQQFSPSFEEIPSNHRRPSLTELQPPTQESADIPFLPTPYKPENLAPTSPTQSEVSTIFTKLSLKQKNQATADPSLYDVKEVSTHYPILGSPIAELQTTVSYETTTIKQDQGDPSPTDVPVIRQRPKQRRRRPGYRLRTTTTTTTEPPPATENYETVDAPRRPLRRRPIRYRTTTPSPEIVRVQTNEETSNSEADTETPDQATERTDDDANNIKSSDQFHQPSIHESSELNVIYEDYAPQKTTTGEPLTTSDEEDIKTTKTPYVETITVREIYKDDSEETTTIITTTTTEAATPKPQQVRRRPIKYDTNRPRFSVKEYRQRLHSSTSTTTEIPEVSSESPRTRYSNRFRRPSTSAPLQTTESSRTRQRYTTKDSVNASIITDKPIKAVNTRLRPFGRYRSTTEATTTQKVSIRPNVFNSLRRPTPISLRKRIYNKLKNNTEEPTTTTETVLEENNDAELSETVETPVPNVNMDESSTEFDSKRIAEDDDESETTVINDIMKNDSILQRVSDLTSSAKDTPGLFKSVAPISRRVPSYFTIATDDPILPIETVFANIKDSRN